MVRIEIMNKPLQVYLDPGELARLDAWARRRGWTKSQAVRVAIRALTRPRDDDPLLAASGMIDGLPRDASEQLDRYLEDTFVAERPASYRGRGGRAKTPVRR
jgi:Ribbon-helix-helix protein, copG family